jgi:lysine-N-methylase
MTLPIKTLPMIERWDCHQCGHCCKGSVVPLSEADVERLRAQKWEKREEFKNTPVMVRESWLGHSHRLAQRADGSCVFLMPDGRCQIHSELGFEAKPLVCRMFPLQIVPRDNSAVLTIRRACPSAAGDLGRPVAEQLAFAKQLARERKLAEEPPTPPAIKSGEHRGWPVARKTLEAAERLLVDERYPVVRRLVHALTFCKLLEQARTRTMDDGKVTELVKVLAEYAPGEVGDVFSNRQQPSGAARVLFRQTAAEIVRLHPGFVGRAGWGARIQLAVAALRMVRGRGKLPPLHPLFPEATFEQLEEPLGVLDAAIYQPLNRMIETTAASWSYALANRSGWSIVESVRMLALFYPLGLWLLRWRSAGGMAHAEFMPEIITALDRGQGYAPLAGGKQRRRLQLLARLEELERLIVWYAR